MQYLRAHSRTPGGVTAIFCCSWTLRTHLCAAPQRQTRLQKRPPHLGHITGSWMSTGIVLLQATAVHVQGSASIAWLHSRPPAAAIRIPDNCPSIVLFADCIQVCVCVRVTFRLKNCGCIHVNRTRSAGRYCLSWYRQYTRICETSTRFADSKQASGMIAQPKQTPTLQNKSVVPPRAYSHKYGNIHGSRFILLFSVCVHTCFGTTQQRPVTETDVQEKTARVGK